VWQLLLSPGAPFQGAAGHTPKAHAAICYTGASRPSSCGKET
jgi:hypothetical protein